jgi:glycosyltransferase involved in cell wall biosynthesis
MLKKGLNALHYARQNGWRAFAQLIKDRLFTAHTLTGEQQLKADLETILIVSHEASRSGAPVLAYNLVRALAGRYNVVVLLMGPGPLSEAFRLAGAAVMSAPNLKVRPGLVPRTVTRLCRRFSFKFALVNSLESRAVLPSLYDLGVPALSLIHEFASCYTRPREVIGEACFWSEEMVFSTRATLEDALAAYPELHNRLCPILPQGRCLTPVEEVDEERLQAEKERIRRLMRSGEAADDVIVLGAGYVNFRKGVDLFLDCAARVIRTPSGRKCRFVWIGKGFEPDKDPEYSVYLADQIRRAGLQERVLFIDETSAIETAYEEADLLLLSSRLDPLPNVAIDAMAHGVPVLCFDKTTGIADFLSDSSLRSECVAAYLDSADMAAKILALADSKTLRQQAADRCRQASMAFFDMKNYVARLQALAENTYERARQEQADGKIILESGLFRSDFACPPQWHENGIEKKVRRYVRTWASGMVRRKPFPGFHPGIYQERHGLATPGTNPFADYLRKGKPEGPWRYPVIGATKSNKKDLPADSRVALHLHVYYPELLAEIMTRLSHNRIRPDLYVSIADEQARQGIVNELNDYPGKIIDIRPVPNRGRNIGPLLTAFGRDIVDHYDFIGHIHTKKSADVKDAAIGRSWQRFLLENLLGGASSGAMADLILAEMNEDSSLGMVFPDDPNPVGWGANRAVGEKLAEQMDLRNLPEQFNFPVGAMFWARTSALAPLLNLKLDWSDYPEEPLPYDGTLPHALERLFSLSLPLENLRSAATNVPGWTR